MTQSIQHGMFAEPRHRCGIHTWLDREEDEFKKPPPNIKTTATTATQVRIAIFAHRRRCLDTKHA